MAAQIPPAGLSEEQEQPSGWRLGFLSGVFLFPTLIGAIAWISVIVIAFTQTGVEPARTIGAPLRVSTAGTDAVFMLTAQQEFRVAGGASRWFAHQGFETVTHVDLWRFDPASGQPSWRKRLVTNSGVNIFDYALWGADGDRLWTFIREPQVRAAANGDVIADAAAIEARNPPLQGVLPRQTSHYRFFDQYGLAVTAADARAWLLDGQTLAAASWPDKSITPKPSVVAPARSAGASITFFQKRGVLLPKDWLGVLTNEEAAILNAEVKVPGAEPGERRGVMADYLSPSARRRTSRITAPSATGSGARRSSSCRRRRATGRSSCLTSGASGIVIPDFLCSRRVPSFSRPDFSATAAHRCRSTSRNPTASSCSTATASMTPAACKSPASRGRMAARCGTQGCPSPRSRP